MIGVDGYEVSETRIEVCSIWSEEVALINIACSQTIWCTEVACSHSLMSEDLDAQFGGTLTILILVAIIRASISRFDCIIPYIII